VRPGPLLTLNPDGTFAYTPNTNFSGSDSFTYKANDGLLDSNTATVTINVGVGEQRLVRLGERGESGEGSSREWSL
jgi:Bacterial Ig domain